MGGRVVDDHVGLAEGDVTALDTSGGLDGGAFDVVPDVPESPAGLAGQVEPAVLPLLSIVVPAYNEALMLMGSLTTLYAYLQDLSDRYRFELIVVDDGSTDETPAIAEAFASSGPRCGSCVTRSTSASGKPCATASASRRATTSSRSTAT